MELNKRKIELINKLEQLKQ